MPDKCFCRIYSFVKNHIILISFVIGILNIISLVGLFFVEYDNNIEVMLPADRDISRSLKFLRDSNFANKIIISLSLVSPDKDKKDLINAVDRLAASLHAPLFTNITVGLPDLEITKSIDFFLENTSQIITSEDLSYIDSQINPKSISKNLQRIYHQMLKPGGIFMHSMIRSDPLGLKLIVLDKLKTLSASMGYKINIEDGHFLSKDGRHAMIIVQTSVAATDMFGSHELFSNLNKEFQQLPDYVSASVISGHSHTLSNQKIMFRDIFLCSAITSIAFIILFVVILRDVATILIFLIPLSSVVLSINLSYLLLGKLSYSIVGLGSVLAGISVDHAIHVYVSVRKGTDPFESVKNVLAPVFAGSITTIATFIAFFFSDVEGYHQLAYFSIIAIILAVIYSLFILPHLLEKIKPSAASRKLNIKKPENFNLSNNFSVILWALLTFIFLILSFDIKFENDIKKLDGTAAEILKEENRFKDIWGHKKRAIFVTTGQDYEKTLQLNDKIYQEATKLIGKENFSSLAMLWPSEKSRGENAARWQRFWKDGREEKLNTWLKKEGGKYQFSEDAFLPFFDNLYKETNTSNKLAENKFLSVLIERFVQKQENEYRLLSFSPDTKDNIQALSKLSRQHPETFILSDIAVSNAISSGLSRNIKLITPIAAILVVLLTYMCLRNVRETITALVPVATSIIWLFGLMALFGLKLNMANLITCIIVLGICVDYGIFMIYKYHSPIDTGTNKAVALAAVTTICSAGSLVFAKHPALFCVGITMVIGVGTGYLSAIFVVPRLNAIFLTPKQHKESL